MARNSVEAHAPQRMACQERSRAWAGRRDQLGGVAPMQVGLRLSVALPPPEDDAARDNRAEFEFEHVRHRSSLARWKRSYQVQRSPAPFTLSRSTFNYSSMHQGFHSSRSLGGHCYLRAVLFKCAGMSVSLSHLPGHLHAPTLIGQCFFVDIHEPAPPTVNTFLSIRPLPSFLRMPWVESHARARRTVRVYFLDPC